MKQESLEKAIEEVTCAIHYSDIDVKDRLELLINLRRFLKSYRESLEVLIDYEKKREKNR